MIRVGFVTLWTFLDLTPHSRQEEWEDSPFGWLQTLPYTLVAEA